MKKIILNNFSLRAALKQLKDIIPSKAAISALANVHFAVKADNTVSLTGSDLEVTIVVSLSCQNETLQDFEFLFPFEFLYKVCELNGDIPIEITLNGNGAFIKGVNDRFEINALDAVGDYPKIPEFPQDGKSIKVDHEFIAWLNKAVLTMSKDTLRPAMSKVCIDIQKEHLTIVSTNAHALLAKKFAIKSKSADELLVGAKFIKALGPCKEAEISWSKNHIAFKSESATVITTRLDDKYVSYRSVIPEYKPNIDFETNAFHVAIKKVAIAAPSATGSARLALKEQIGIVSINAIEDGVHSSKIELPGDYTGDVDYINFSVNIMLTMLNQISFEHISLAIHHRTKAILITSPDDEGYLGLIMPLL